MRVPANFNLIFARREVEMSVMKKETGQRKRFFQPDKPLNRPPIVVPRDVGNLRSQSPRHFAKLLRLRDRSPTVDDVSEQNQTLRPVVGDQFAQPRLDPLHPPEREQRACPAQLDLVAVVEVRDREPARAFVGDCEASVEDHVGMNSGCCRHAETCSRKNWFFPQFESFSRLPKTRQFTMSKKPAQNAPEEVSEHKLIAVRREKLQQLLDKGVNPYGGRFDTTHQPGELRANFEEGKNATIAGRMVAKRGFGKSSFIELADIDGKIQVHVAKGEVDDECFANFKLLDMGDWLGVEGETFNTQTGEPSLRAKKLTVLCKALRPLPDKHKGIADRELSYRKRYLDLIATERSRDIFIKRSQMVFEIRTFLRDRGFLEVETPMLQDVAGGAAAKPFETRHNALSMDLYLRIAPELYLKRLLVGGFTKVFELNRNFRNEGISTRHNPEFTMLEAYWAYADFEMMADMVEEMTCHLAEKFCGGLKIEHKNSDGEVTKTIDLSRPWKRASYRSLIEEIDADWFSYTDEKRRERCAELGVQISPDMEDYEVTQQIFEKLIEEHTFDPCYVTHVPKELVPLAKQNAEDDSVVDVYELIINGQEISPGYSELNDPVVQRARLEEQAGEEIQNIDEDFLEALEHGMPPAGGIGVGIDRLIMMLTGAESIRDVVLFPQLKRKAD
ncbi:MAG: lysyl-tRNA synthetase class 2 [Verrucomicrobiales bacterium]|jgi:lysyl-tRNA synthetase class 2